MYAEGLFLPIGALEERLSLVWSYMKAAQCKEREGSTQRKSTNVSTVEPPPLCREVGCIDKAGGCVRAG